MTAYLETGHVVLRHRRPVGRSRQRLPVAGVDGSRRAVPPFSLNAEPGALAALPGSLSATPSRHVCEGCPVPVGLGLPALALAANKANSVNVVASSFFIEPSRV